MASLFPRISGLATISPGLTVFDIPVQWKWTIDGILVPGLFILLYTIAILLYPSRRPASRGRELLLRLGAVLAGSFILVFCAATGYLLSDGLHDYLPGKIQNAIDSLGINADVAMPFSDYKLIHLRGDIISLVCLIIGITLFVWKINRNPTRIKSTPLTREQRMSPYERMLWEKRAQGASRPITPQPAPKLPRQPAAKRPGTKTLCHNQPLYSLEPEAVGYMPLR